MDSGRNENPYDPPLEQSQTTLKLAEGEKLTVLATFSAPLEAHTLKNALIAESIPAVIGNESSAPLFGASIAGQSSAFWVEVLVRESDAAAALEIKKQFLKSGPAETEIPEWSCVCGKTVDEGFSVCWNCQAEYSAE